MKAKIEIGTQVQGKKGNGTIVKIITKSTGYVLVEWENGTSSKEMAFNLTCNGEELKKKPAARVSAPVSELDAAKAKMMWINNTVYGDRNSMSYQISEEMLGKIIYAAEKTNDTFVKSVAESVERSMRCSEKQAYVLASFSINQKITL